MCFLVQMVCLSENCQKKRTHILEMFNIIITVHAVFALKCACFKLQRLFVYDVLFHLMKLNLQYFCVYFSENGLIYCYLGNSNAQIICFLSLVIILQNKCNLKYYLQAWILINFNHIKYVMMFNNKIIWKIRVLIGNMSICLNK